MEQALFIEDVVELEDLHPDYGRIYFGEEFCGRRLASPETYRRVAERCRSMGKRLTLLTPLVTEPELELLAKAIDPVLAIARTHPELGLEIVFNDWGVFQHYRGGQAFEPVLGSLLVRQKRDPGFLWLRGPHCAIKLDKMDMRHIQSLNIDSNMQIRKFVEANFVRMELVNTVQGWETECRLPASLYLPLVPVTTTRYCKWAAIASGAQNASNYFACAKPCRTQLSRHTTPDYALYLYGNTQFYLNSRLPDRLDGVDRLVSYSFSPFLEERPEGT